MSLFAASAVQDDPKRRRCALPPYVADDRFPTNDIAYLVILHNHPVDDVLSEFDLNFLVHMAQLHGFTPSVKGRQASISIVAFLGREQNGSVSCTGFYQYLPAPSSKLVKVVNDTRTGHWREILIGHIKWNENGTYTLER